MREPAGTARIDVAAERVRTPGCTTGHHLNAAGAALPTAGTVEVIVDHLRLESMIGGYEAAREARLRLNAVYGLAAGLIGAEAREIALVESATAGWQRAVAALRLRSGDRVLAARSSYVSSALQLLAAERECGASVELLANGADGAVDLEELERALRRGPAALVTASHVPTTSGLVEPVVQIGALCREYGVPFLLDATQSLGQLPVDVRAIGCDLLVTTGRKFLRGPRGTGLLYVGGPLLSRFEPIAPDVRGARWTGERSWTLAPDATRFELWEAAHALRLGLGSALADLRALGTVEVADRLAASGRSLRESLAGLPGVQVTDPPAAGGAIVTFAVDALPAAEVVAELTRRGVHVVSVPAGHGRWDLDARDLNAIVRASVHVYNDDDDIHALAEAVREIVASRRSDSVRPGTEGGRARVAAVPRTAAGPANGSGPRYDAEVVVAGLGAHGSAALHQLARRGVAVIGMEQYALGHDRGSSHGATRMIRRAYPDAIWDPLVEAAYLGWADLEEDYGQRLVTRTGGLFVHPAGQAGGLRGPGCTEIDRAAAARIAPGLRIPEGHTAVYDPAAGVIDAARAVRAQLDLARAAGAEIREGVPVVAWEPDGEGVIVHTPSGRIRARRLVLSAGPWTGRLVPELAPALRVTRIVNAYFGADPDLLGPPNLGCFSVELPVGLLYGIPATGGRGLKVGLEPGEPCDPDAPRRRATGAELAVLSRAVEELLPAAGPLEEHLTCLYTMTEDRRFVVGALPGTPQVAVASACSGHGFKFAPVIGMALADLACGLPRPDLDFLSLARLPTAAQR
jgi:cysteine desulfurase / selenocysteine lyase